MDIDHHTFYERIALRIFDRGQLVQDMLKQGFASDRHKSLRKGVRNRFQAGSKTGREYHSLHSVFINLL